MQRVISTPLPDIGMHRRGVRGVLLHAELGQINFAEHLDHEIQNPFRGNTMTVPNQTTNPAIANRKKKKRNRGWYPESAAWSAGLGSITKGGDM